MTQDMEIIRDDVKVELENIGEGLCGDYNEDDENDVNLLRFSVYVKEGGYWEAVDDASYCTYISADTPDDECQEYLELLMDNFYDELHEAHDTSVKKLGEYFSHLGA